MKRSGFDLLEPDGMFQCSACGELSRSFIGIDAEVAEENVWRKGESEVAPPPRFYVRLTYETADAYRAQDFLLRGCVLCGTVRVRLDDGPPR